MLYSVDSSIQMQRVLKFAASIRDICQIRDVVRKKRDYVGRIPKLGGGTVSKTKKDPQALI